MQTLQQQLGITDEDLKQLAYDASVLQQKINCKVREYPTLLLSGTMSDGSTDTVLLYADYLNGYPVIYLHIEDEADLAFSLEQLYNLDWNKNSIQLNSINDATQINFYKKRGNTNAFTFDNLDSDYILNDFRIDSVNIETFRDAIQGLYEYFAEL